MSYRIGMDTLNLRPAERLAHTEYCTHDVLKRTVMERSGGSFEDAWEFDLLWHTNDGPVPWEERGRTTDMGHAEFLEGGVDKRGAQPCPFRSAEEVWQFDAVEEYGLPPLDDLAGFYEECYRMGRERYPGQVFPGGYYKTLISGAIQAFGWEMLLVAAADQDRFEKVLDSIFRLSAHHYLAWSRTSIEAFISHDDIVWSQGPFMHPDFYRRAVFPRFRELWKILKDAGKKVLYCSDANWTQFVDDVAGAGADGFIIEPMVPLEKVVEAYGGTHVIIGSKVDCRTLTMGSKEQIRAEIDDSLALARRCPGFVFAVGNHIPSNVPLENALFYFDYLRENWRR